MIFFILAKNIFPRKKYLDKKQLPDQEFNTPTAKGRTTDKIEIINECQISESSATDDYTDYKATEIQNNEPKESSLDYFNRNGLLVCGKCKGEFVQKRALLSHGKIIQEGTSYKCTHCDYHVRLKSNLTKHIRAIKVEATEGATMDKDETLSNSVETNSEIIDKCAEVIDIKLGQERSSKVISTAQDNIEINSEVGKPPSKVVVGINLSVEAHPAIISTPPNLYETSPEKFETSKRDIEIDQTVKTSTESIDMAPVNIEASISVIEKDLANDSSPEKVATYDKDMLEEVFPMVEDNDTLTGNMNEAPVESCQEDVNDYLSENEAGYIKQPDNEVLDFDEEGLVLPWKSVEVEMIGRGIKDNTLIEPPPMFADVEVLESNSSTQPAQYNNADNSVIPPPCRESNYKKEENNSGVSTITLGEEFYDTTLVAKINSTEKIITSDLTKAAGQHRNNTKNIWIIVT